MSVHVRWPRHLVVIGFLGGVVGLGVRSIVTGDGRYGWGMFAHQAAYDVGYQWVLRDGGAVRYRPGPELRGAARRISGERRRRTCYSIAAVQAWIDGYAKHMAASHAPRDAVAFRAVMTYQINRDGQVKRAVLEHPTRQPDGRDV